MRIETSIRFTPGRLASLAVALVLIMGCGDNLERGPDGPPGEPGVAGAPGTPGELEPELSTLDRVFAGIGGQAALDGLTGVTIEASGVRRITGEGLRFDEPAITVDQFDVTMHVDMANDAMRVDWSRNALFFGGVPLTYSEIINGDLGYVDGDDNIFGTLASTTDMPSARWAAVRKQALLTNPHALLAMISANPDLASDGNPAVHNGAVHDVIVVQDDIFPVSLLIDPSTGHVAKLSTVENDHLHRDVPIEVEFDDWQDASGVAFPMTVRLLVNGEVWHEEYRTAVTHNPTFTDEFDFPAGADPMYDETAATWGAQSHQFLQGFTSLGVTQDVEQLTVTPTMLAEGVFFLGGSSHNSMAIEQDNGVVILEAPLYPERSEAILAWVASEPSFDGKSVSHLVVTHHHHDHSGGFRPFVAAGAAIVVSAASAGFLAELAQRPSTIVPDAQAMNPRPATILPVSVNSQGLGSRTFPATAPLPTVSAIQFRSSHAHDMIVTFIDIPGTQADYIFQSDLFTPDPMGTGAALTPQIAQELLDLINAFGFNRPGVTLVGGHGSFAPLTQLEDFLSPPLAP